VSDSVFQKIRGIALDSAGSEEARFNAIRRLASFRNRAAAVALVELGSRPGEAESISRAAGSALADLLVQGLVSEWDIRDLTPSAADAFHE
jgi:hypothetical protein